MGRGYRTRSLVMVVFGLASVGCSDPTSVSPMMRERSVLNAVEIYHDYDSVKEYVEYLDFDSNVPMSSSAGSDYMCLNSKPKHDSQGKDGATNGEDSDSGDTLESRLHGLKGVCFKKREGYWTYVVCPFDKVEQVHFEGNKRVQVIELGKLDSTQSDPLQQEFTGGDSDRRTTVRYICSESGDAAVTSIQEPVAYAYEIVVSTPLACNATLELQARQLLNPLRGNCLLRVDGWWTYELCFMQRARQYHKGKNTKDNSEYTLGVYSQAQNEKLEAEGKALIKQAATQTAAYVQLYTKGTVCELTRKKRTTKVVYVCSPNSYSKVTELISVEESSTCGYVFRVATPLLCSHPFFKTHSKDQSVKPTNIIYCVPKTLYHIMLDKHNH